METKTSPKLLRELFAQIKSNLVCQVFVLQMVFESSSSQPSVGWQRRFAELQAFGRAGKFLLIQVKHQARSPKKVPVMRQQRVPTCTSDINPRTRSGGRESLPGRGTRGVSGVIYSEMASKNAQQAGEADRHGRAGRGQLPVC